MGFSPAQLAALRAMAEGFFDTRVLVLTPTAALDDLGEPQADSYSARTYPARLARRERQVQQGTLSDAPHELADWELSLAFDAELSARDVVVPGGLAWAGVWSQGTAYGTGDAVKFGGRFFVAKAPTSNLLSDTAAWAETPAFEVTAVNLPASNRVRLIADLKLIA